MLSLGDAFRQKKYDIYRNAPLDAPSFHRLYRACSAGGCAALCCNGGSGFYMQEESGVIEKLAKDHADFFTRHNVPVAEGVLDEEKNDDGTVELCTKVRDIAYPSGALPPHFPSTACIFRREHDTACTLQLLGLEQDKPGWWYKPLACWLFPIELEHDGSPKIHVAHASTDEDADETYPGFVGYTQCGAGCDDGKPAYQVLKKEIETLSHLLGRDLLGEILSHTEVA